jgi:hypothetical protein
MVDMQHRTIGKCSICGGRVTCPAGPIGYAGPLENLIRCGSCGARKATGGPIIEMEPADLTPFQKAQRHADRLRLSSSPVGIVGDLDGWNVYLRDGHIIERRN